MNSFTKLSLFVFILIFISSIQLCIAQSPAPNSAAFQWPEGKKMALTLSFDDARLSQIDRGIPLLDKYAVKGTFYVLSENVSERLKGWKEAIKKGHDIGNHSFSHPCSANYGWPVLNQLELFTLERMSKNLDSASSSIKTLLGVDTFSFAYPCGLTFVGKGIETKSYVPLIASSFETGRLWMSEAANNPQFCDMAQLGGIGFEGKSFDEIKELIESAKREGKWLILVGHEINGQELATLEMILKYATDPANGIWIDHVRAIASYVREKRGEARFVKSSSNSSSSL